MSDDDDEDQYLQTGPKTLFGEKYQQRGANEPPPTASKKDAIAWADKYYATTWIVGKFMIINERIDNQYSLMTKKDFIDSLENMRITITEEDGKAKIIPVSKLWLEYPLRRTYELGVIFDPKYEFDSKTMRSGAYNIWPGFAIEPKQGNCHLNLEFIKNVICSGNEKHYHYTMSWISQIIQEPWNKLGVALVLHGLKGVGKSYFAKMLSMLLDGINDRKQKLCLTIDNKQSIFGNHNDHFESKILLFLEEAIWAGDKAHESTLKHIITGDSLFVNPKNLPGRTVRNYMRPVLIGNADWLVPASHDERRYFVLNVNSEHKDDKDYFDAREYELLNGGLEALMYELMHYDYKDVNLRTALVTPAQVEQKIESMVGVEKWWFDLLTAGKLPFVKEDKRGYLVIKEKMYSDFCRAQVKMNSRNKYSERGFGEEFMKLLPLLDSNGKKQHYKNGKVISIVKGDDKHEADDKKRYNVYTIPKLSVCRLLFEVHLAPGFEWDGDGEWSYPTFSDSDIGSSHIPF
jgi:Family of unknown function (DUF5906)